MIIKRDAEKLARQWILDHLQLCEETSLARKDVYEEYESYVRKLNAKLLLQSDFGKVMRSAFPDVKSRRLGARGSSRYCYAGLRKSTFCAEPSLPTLGISKIRAETPTNTMSNNTNSAPNSVKNISNNSPTSMTNSVCSISPGDDKLFLNLNVKKGMDKRIKVEGDLSNGLAKSKISDDNLGHSAVGLLKNINQVDLKTPMVNINAEQPITIRPSTTSTEYSPMQTKLFNAFPTARVVNKGNLTHFDNR